MNFIQQCRDFLDFVDNDQFIPVGGNFLAQKRRTQQERGLQLGLQKVEIAGAAVLLFQQSRLSNFAGSPKKRCIVAFQIDVQDPGIYG